MAKMTLEELLEELERRRVTLPGTSSSIIARNRLKSNPYFKQTLTVDHANGKISTMVNIIPPERMSEEMKYLTPEEQKKAKERLREENNRKVIKGLRLPVKPDKVVPFPAEEKEKPTFASIIPFPGTQRGRGQKD